MKDKDYSRISNISSANCSVSSVPSVGESDKENTADEDRKCLNEDSGVKGKNKYGKNSVKANITGGNQSKKEAVEKDGEDHDLSCEKLNMEVKVILESAKLKRRVRTKRGTCYSEVGQKNSENRKIDPYDIKESSDDDVIVKKTRKGKKSVFVGVSNVAEKPEVETSLEISQENVMLSDETDGKEDKCVIEKAAVKSVLGASVKVNSKELHESEQDCDKQTQGHRRSLHRSCKTKQLPVILEDCDSTEDFEEVKPTRHSKRKRNSSRNSKEGNVMGQCEHSEGTSNGFDDHWTKEEKDRLTE